MISLVEAALERRTQEQLDSIRWGEETQSPSGPKRCQNCDKEFHAGRNQAAQKYCSRACYLEEMAVTAQLGLPF